MGQDKAFLDLGGVPIIRRLIEAFSRLFSGTLVVANNPQTYAELSTRVVPDLCPGRGPLSGIHSGLTHAEHDWAFVCPCDCAFLNPDVVRGMWDLRGGVDTVVAVTVTGPQPLNAWYSSRCLDSLRTCLDAGQLRAVDFCGKIRSRTVDATQLDAWDPSGRMFWSLNTPEDYAKAAAAYQELSRDPHSPG